MGAVGVVVVDVVDDESLELLVVPDDGAVELSRVTDMIPPGLRHPAADPQITPDT